MYLNLIEIAESFGVSERTIQDWVLNEGLPCTSDRGRLLFDRGQVATWASGRGLAAQAGFLASDPGGSAASLKLEELLRRGGIWRDLGNAELPDAFLRVLAGLPGALPPIQRLLRQRVAGKGGITFAPVGGGFALPHLSARLSLGEGSGVVALMFLREPLQFTEPKVDEAPVVRLAFFNAPSPRAHLDLLGRLSRALARGAMRDPVLRGAPDREILAAAAADDAAAGRAEREGVS